MTIDQFRERFGQAMYGFLQSDLGRALIAVLEKNDPVTRVSHQPQEVQKEMGQMYFWQTTGWRDCINTIENHLIVRDGQTPRDIESTYGADYAPEEEAGGGAAVPQPEPTRRTPKRKKSRK